LINANIEQTVLRNLLTNEEYMRRVLPFIRPEYFEGVYQQLFREVAKFVAKYNKLPNGETFKIELDESNGFTDEQYRHAVEILPEIFKQDDADETWLRNGARIVHCLMRSWNLSLSLTVNTKS